MQGEGYDYQLGGCGSALSCLAGWLLWPDTALLHHCQRYMQQTNTSVLRRDSDSNQGVEVSKCMSDKRKNGLGVEEVTPSNRFSFRAPSPLNCAFLNLFVYVRLITQT